MQQSTAEVLVVLPGTWSLALPRTYLLDATMSHTNCWLPDQAPTTICARPLGRHSAGFDFIYINNHGRRLHEDILRGKAPLPDLTTLHNALEQNISSHIVAYHLGDSHPLRHQSCQHEKDAVCCKQILLIWSRLKFCGMQNPDWS